METLHSGNPDPGSTNSFDEKLFEKLSPGPGSPETPSNRLTLDTHLATLRNGPSESPATGARTPNRQTVEIARSHPLPLRTLPGIFSSFVIVFNAVSNRL